MKRFRNLMVSLAVFFTLLFCFGTSVQAATVEERVELRGPQPQPIPACTGDVVGRTTIEHDGPSLAESIVGGVLDKDKSDDRVLVTIRFRNGPPDETFNVEWVALDTPGVCNPAVNNMFLGQMTTDANGRGSARFTLLAGSKFPGQGVRIEVCAGTGPSDSCQNGDDVYVSLFTIIPPP